MINLDNEKLKMKKVIEHLQKDFSGLRTGRASTSLIDRVVVNVYGSDMPLAQLASISVLDNITLSVSVWDKSNVQAVEKAIMQSNLGLNPVTEGSVLRITLPSLNQERRKELAKAAAKYAETARVSIRNIRRDVNEAIKKSEKAKEISEDESKKLTAKVQQLTDDHIQEVDKALTVKEKDILTV